MQQHASPTGGVPVREFVVRAGRINRLPKMWIWAIYEANRPAALHRSSRSYRSAEDAWAVGNRMLMALREHARRKPQAYMPREPDACAEACEKVRA